MKWKNFIWVIFAAALSVLSTQSSVLAAFEDTGTGARPTVMGGTYVAAGDDVQSLMYNPAGLAQLHTKEITSEYSRLYTGLTDGSNLGQYFMGYGQPIKYGGTLAFGWKQLDLDELYTERTLSLGYGEWITSKIAAGIAVKQLYHSFGAPNMVVDDNGNVQNGTPSFFARNGNSSTAYSTDLGILYRWTGRDTIGFSIQDVNEPNIALNPDDHEIVSRTLRAGLSHRGFRGLTWAGSLTSKESLSNQQDYIWTGAVEKWWDMKDMGSFAGRGSLATGSRSFQQMAMGGSYRYDKYQIDYAFVFNLTGVSLGNTAGTHRFSFSYRFGESAPEKVRIIKSKDQKPAVTPAAAQPQRSQKLPDVEIILENDAHREAQKAAGVAVVQAVPAAPKAQTVPLVAGETRAPMDEAAATAQLMQHTPVVSAPAAGQPGPGIPLSVPAATPAAQVAPAPVQPSDMVVPVQPRAGQSALDITQRITRLDMLARVDGMVKSYTERVEARLSADLRLQAFGLLYPTLEGYVQSRDGELLELMDKGEGLAQSARDYEALKWEGASAQQRLTHLARAMESIMPPALRDRVWDKNDLRDRRYKQWLEQALAKGHLLTANGASAHARVTYWGGVAHKALEFEGMPSEPAPIRVTPVAPIQPPAQKVPVVSPAKPAKTAQENAVDKPESKGLEGSKGGIPEFYRVKEGDTLIGLAKRFYGDYNRWRDIYILNQDRLDRGGNLRPGQLLIMPPKEKR